MPPLAHWAHRVVVDLRGVRHVVTLPRVRLVLIDLLLNVFEVAFAHVQQAMGEHSRRTRNLIDEISCSSRLCGGQDLSGQCLLNISRWTTRLIIEINHARGYIAEQCDVDLAVEINILDELRDQEILRLVRQTNKRRIPYTPDLAALVLQVPWIHRIPAAS